MVVAHNSTSALAAGATPTKSKKNRRKITRKNPSHFPSDPSSSAQRNEQDEEMSFDASVGDAVPSFAESGAQILESSKDVDDDDLMIDADPTLLEPSASAAPTFAPVAPGADRTTLKSETRRIPIPPHRMTPLKKDWLHIFGPLTEILGLQVRMNVQRRSVEIRVRIESCFDYFVTSTNSYAQTSKHTKDIGAIQKGADFVKAYALGFDVNVSLFPKIKTLAQIHLLLNSRTLLLYYDWTIYT